MSTSFIDYEVSPHADATLSRFVGQRGVSRTFVNGRYEHCRERYNERFNADISYQDWETLNYAIFSDDSSISEYVDVGTTPGTSLYILNYQGRTMLVAYSDNTFCMMTILPKSDGRLAAYNQRRYQASGLSDFAMRHVEARQEAAVEFHAATARPFVEALSKVEIVTPVTEPEMTSEPATSNEPVTSDEPVATLFFRLDQTIQKKLDADGAATKEIEALEARLAALRTEAKLSDLAGRLLAGAREMGGATFEQFAANMITAQDARQTVALLLSRVGDPVIQSAPLPEPVVQPEKKTRTRSLNRPFTTMAEKRKRNLEIIRRLKAGETQARVASDYGLSVAGVGAVIKKMRESGDA